MDPIHQFEIKKLFPIARIGGMEIAFTNSALFMLIALIVVYIILGVLYESFIHPLTILSGLPSAAAGALITLYVFGLPLTIYAYVGMMMLIGIGAALTGQPRSRRNAGIFALGGAVLAEQRRGLGPGRGLDHAKAGQSQHLGRRPGLLALARVGRRREPAERALRIALARVKPVGADPRFSLAATVAFAERVQDLLRGDRRFVEADADGVVDRIGDRRDHRVQRAFPGLLRAERTFGVDAFDDDRLEDGSVERGRDLVVEERRLLVEAAAEDLLLADDLAVPHVGRTFDLALDVRGIQRAAAVMRGGHLVHREHPGLQVDRDFGDRGLVRIGRRWTDARTFERSADTLGRLVAPGRDERPVLGLGEHRRIREQVAREIRPEFIQLIEGGHFVPTYAEIVSMTPQEVLDKAAAE